MKKFLRVRTVAMMLECSPKAVYNLIYQGKIKYIRYTLKNIRISEEDLLEYLNSHKTIENYREPYSNYNVTK